MGLVSWVFLAIVQGSRDMIVDDVLKHMKKHTQCQHNHFSLNYQRRGYSGFLNHSVSFEQSHQSVLENEFTSASPEWEKQYINVVLKMMSSSQIL